MTGTKTNRKSEKVIIAFSIFEFNLIFSLSSINDKNLNIILF